VDIFLVKDIRNSNINKHGDVIWNGKAKYKYVQASEYFQEDIIGWD
jgi:hypothetical protein